MQITSGSSAMKHFKYTGNGASSCCAMEHLYGSFKKSAIKTEGKKYFLN